jgi:hypothetical protein
MSDAHRSEKWLKPNPINDHQMPLPKKLKTWLYEQIEKEMQ